MSENVVGLIIARFLGTSITNPVVSRFDRFTAYFNCLSEMSENSYLHVFSKCTGITNIVLSRFDRSTPYYNCMSENVRELIIARFKSY